jgi:hypothetical protein
MPLLLFCLLLLVVSCNPYRFRMGEGNVLDAQILSRLDKVDKGKYAVALRDTGKIWINRHGVTEYRFVGYLRLDQGDGASIYIRPAIAAQLEDEGVRVALGIGGTVIDSGGKFLARHDRNVFEGDSLIRLEIYNDSEYMQVIADCDTLLRAHVAMKESDDLIFMAHPGSKVLFFAPTWNYLEDR